MEMKGRIRELMKDTINFPKELIYISRNMNLVRSLNKFYGGIADRIPIMAKAANFGTSLEHSHCKFSEIQTQKNRLITIGRTSDSQSGFGLCKLWIGYGKYFQGRALKITSKTKQ